MSKTASSALYEFLNSSTIHGLRYLVVSRSPLIRLLWLASISACVAAAAAIIYLNVANWSNTPAVVTKVNPALAKDKDFMPMITVCPLYPNHNRLVYKLASLYPEVVEEKGLIQQVTDIISENLVAAKVAETELTGSYSTNTAKTMFQPCQYDTTNSSECRFVLVLAGIGNAIRYVDYNFLGVKAYIRDRAVAKEDVSLQGLEDYVEDYYGIVIDDKIEFPRYNYHYQSVIQMYSFFFPVFKDDRRREVEVLRPLEDYALPKIKTESVTADDIASLLAYMIDFNFMHDHDVLDGADALNNVTASALFHLSAKYLGISDDSPDSVEQVYNIINSFSYEPLWRPFFGYRPLDAYDNKYKLFCEAERQVYELELESFSIHKLCSGEHVTSNGTIELTDECQWYCQTIVNNQDTHELVRSFYDLAIDLEGPLVPDNPATLLPVCRFPGEGEPPLLKEGCWNRIVNDKGICFSSVTDGSRSRIHGIGFSHAFQFAIDVGGKFYINELLPTKQMFTQEYDIMVTPPNHFAIGRLSEELRTSHRYEAGDAIDDWVIKVELDYIAEGTGEFRAMAPAKRNCLYPDEKELQHFPAYSEPNCVLECAWRAAARRCACAPWFLRAHHPEVDTCEAHGNECFVDIVRGRYDLVGEECMEGCLPDCETVEYSISPPEKKYSQGFGGKGDKTEANEVYYDYATTEKVENAKPEIIDVIQTIQRSNSNLDNVGLVSVYVNKKSTLRIILTATVTVIDMISNIGGTLGLFCGFSILSAAEIVYWLGVMLAKRKL